MSRRGRRRLHGGARRSWASPATTPRISARRAVAISRSKAPRRSGARGGGGGWPGPRIPRWPRSTPSLGSRRRRRQASAAVVPRRGSRPGRPRGSASGVNVNARATVPVLVLPWRPRPRRRRREEEVHDLVRRVRHQDEQLQGRDAPPGKRRQLEVVPGQEGPTAEEVRGRHSNCSSSSSSALAVSVSKNPPSLQ